MALLPIAIVVAIVLWAAFTPFSIPAAAGLGIAIATTFVLRYINNSLQLIRVRSWAVSSLYLLLIAICAPVHHWNPLDMGVGALGLVYIIGLLSSYQARKPQVCIFIAALALALLTMYVPVLLWLVPACIVAMIAALRSFSGRTLAALLFGFLLPYELWAGWHIYAGTLMTALSEYSAALQAISLPALTNGADTADLLIGYLLQKPVQLALLLSLFGICSLVHFLRTSFNDKIRTRMHYITLILHWPVLLLLLILCTGYQPQLYVMLILCSSPLLAHYFVFSKGWMANIIFWLFLSACSYLALQVS